MGHPTHEGDNMKHITILALDGTVASTVTGPTDIFGLAGVLWNQICGVQPEPYFKVVIASVKGKPVKCVNGIVIQPHLSLDEVRRTDLIIISAEDLAALDAASRQAIPWLLKHHKAGTTLASVCTGAFLLAQTGLLDGKRATTHWGFAELFRKRYPQVDLRPECLITDEGSLVCGGGAFSYFDLSLYLVERYGGFEVATQCGKSLLLDIGRTSQVPYAIFEYQKQHKDPQVLKAQTFIEKDYAQQINMDDLAARVGMSLRNFKRRFRRATGDSPLSYLQRFRVEAAKRQFENTHQSISEICYQVGYEDLPFFRGIFKRYVGLSPNEYRKRIQAR
jgi:transcriptional regulator GlxA family with amidase domain